ncbi:hypothetical protein [Sphaerisporangium sp. TRM90804]|uniref:hypothetical protein n=1 Tax=Sphaerisporangium sp. TRM90804 TaxID=3031113 RepID=UPI002447ADF0|nr:hypothetical protein [Sphaerisporangium sp. TRM90804]MDH2424993.1 hypothetical protein [Sphaerisporangium sp. TRM90804]
MDDFTLGVLSSLFATVLTCAGGWMLARRPARWPLLLLSRLTGLGVERVYAHQRDSNHDLPADLARARWVKVLAGRGNEITRDGFVPVWHGAGNAVESVRILLPDPARGTGSWLATRADELRRVDRGFSFGLLAEQIAVNAAYILEVARQRDDVVLRFYNLPNLHRVILTDHIAYLTFYGQHEHGRNSPCLVARRPGLLYDYAALLFSTAWESGRPPEDPDRAASAV